MLCSASNAAPATTEIKRAYRKLISQHHPDKLGNVPDELKRRAEERAREINAAYEKIQERAVSSKLTLPRRREMKQTPSSPPRSCPRTSPDSGRKSTTCSPPARSGCIST